MLTLIVRLPPGDALAGLAAGFLVMLVFGLVLAFGKRHVH